MESLNNVKKALQLASVASMIDQFNMLNIELMQSAGYQVDVVADFTNPGNISTERAKDLLKRLKNMNVRVVDIAIPRNLNMKSVINAFKKVKDLITTEHYSLIHCHSPIGGAITRLAAKGERKKGTKIIYTAHGFHFYDGAPLKNWIVFYLCEKWLSRYTDILITINREDYKRAKKILNAKKTVYVPGIGVDIKKFQNVKIDRRKKRADLGIEGTNVIFLLSVGELNKNKNHRVVVNALGHIENSERSHIHYFIAGKDAGQGKELVRLAKEKDVNLHLLGFRTDISELLKAADIFLLPSIREGLNVGLMEAMASGLPCLLGKIRGNVDLVKDNEFLFNPKDENSVADAIKNMIALSWPDIGKRNILFIKKYDIEKIRLMMNKIYTTI